MVQRIVLRVLCPNGRDAAAESFPPPHAGLRSVFPDRRHIASPLNLNIFGLSLIGHPFSCLRHGFCGAGLFSGGVADFSGFGCHSFHGNLNLSDLTEYTIATPDSAVRVSSYLSVARLGRVDHQFCCPIGCCCMQLTAAAIQNYPRRSGSTDPTQSGQRARSDVRNGESEHLTSDGRSGYARPKPR